MIFAYADPPYIGQAKKHYGKHPDYAGDVNHGELIGRLVAEYPDGWALSLSSVSLQQIAPMCPPGVRIGAWVKPWCSYKPGVNPAYAWEPVIWTGGRKRERWDDKIRDWIAQNARTNTFDEQGQPFSGAKPKEFCFWIFELLNMTAEDELHDIFPGSGAVGRAWEAWKRQPRLPLAMNS